MKEFLLVLICVGGCGTEDADEAPPPMTRCEQLREHLVDLRLAGVVSIDREAHRAAQLAAMGSDFLASCARLPDASITCALEAPDGATARRQLQRPPTTTTRP